LSLFKQSVTGTAWTFIDIVLNKAIFFLSTLILARMLGPVEFGVLGMIMVFFAIGTALVDSGLSVSIIRTAQPSPLEYSTVFFLNLFLSIVSYIFVFFIAPFVAAFYEQESLVSLIRVYCIGFIISAFRIIPSAILVKNMNFRSITLFNIPGNIIGLVVGVWMALNGFKVWSIVGLFLSTQIVSSCIYFFFGNWKPIFSFSYHLAKVHWKFGYKLMISTQINIIFENLYNVLIGKNYSVQTLGYYERAYTLSNYPISILMLISNRVSLPLFAQITQDVMRTKLIFRRVLLFSFFITAPLMLGAIVVAEPLIAVVLGKKWIPTVLFFQIICLSYIWYPIHILNINLLTALGRSDLFLKLEILKKGLLIVSIYVGISFGIMGLIWSSVFTSSFSVFLNTYYSGKLFNYSSKEQLMDILPTLSIALVAATITYYSKSLYIGYSPISTLVLLSFEGLIIFIGLSFVTKNESLNELLSLAKRRLYNSRH
jgi:O-antigen/teichoic acid export membrane protein